MTGNFYQDRPKDVFKASKGALSFMQKRASGRCPGDPYMRLRDQLTMMLVDEAVPNGLVIVGSEVLEGGARGEREEGKIVRHTGRVGSADILMEVNVNLLFCDMTCWPSSIGFVAKLPS